MTKDTSILHGFEIPPKRDPALIAKWCREGANPKAMSNKALRLLLWEAAHVIEALSKETRP